MLLRLLLYLSMGLGGIHAIQAQSNLKQRWLEVEMPMRVTDSLSIAPETVKIIRSQPQSETWVQAMKVQFEGNANQIILEYDSLGSFIPDSILISYRTFPINFQQKVAKRSQAAYDSGLYNIEADPLLIIDPYNQPILREQREEIFSTSNLNKTGSISRGVSFGSAQDVFVNSALNLQLEGNLTPDIKIAASISDQEVPLQPEGNTQQLQEFDRVFINLSHEKGELKAGDVVLKNDESQFLRYYKNVQGGQVEVRLGDTSAVSSVTKVGVALAKGQFHSQQIEPLEGVSGPYRLVGPNNERFLIILANSEKVFLDGVLMERGFNYDYIIDYNTAEITFTNRVVITKFSRIRVDFEFSTQNYGRTILQASHHQKVKKLNTFVQFYSEKDNRNNALSFGLDDQDRAILSSIGDSLDAAVAPAIDTVGEFSANRILYVQKDTIVDGRTFQIFERATGEDSVLFSVGFSEVLLGQGDYVLDNPTANGRVYQWVAPIDGISQGRYAPVRLLAAPNKRQMTTIGASYELNQSHSIFLETALSDHDQNLFSEVDNDDNQGLAVKLGWKNKGSDISFLPKFKWFSSFDYEFDQANFRGIDRFRYIEFDRDWSLDSEEIASDQIINAQLGIRRGNAHFFQYRATQRKRGLAVNGFQHQFDAKTHWNSLHVNSQIFVLNNDRNLTQSEWVRLKTNVYQKGKKLIKGYVYSIDKNQILATDSDSVISSAMNFESHEFYLQNGDSSKTQFKAAYNFRTDNAPINGELRQNNQAQTASLALKRNQKGNLISILFNYRRLENLNLPDNAIEETISGRLDWNQSFFKKHVKSELVFSNASGRELRREFVFVQVDNGIGTHTWRDDNGDGVQDLNEFYLAINPDEKNFAKFFTPTDEYILAFTSNFNYRLKIEAPRNWLKQKGWKGFVGKFSSNSSFVVNRKITDDNIFLRFLPFGNRLEDENLITNRSIVRNTIFYNRKNPKFGLEFQSLISDQKQLLTNGFEDRQSQESNLQMRWNLGKSINTKINISTASLSNQSDFLLERNFSFNTISGSPELSFQPNTQLRLTSSFAYKDKQDMNSESDPIKAVFHEANFQVRWAKAIQRSINANFRFVSIRYNGEENSPLGYEMLEALRTGTNLTWNVNWIQRLSNGLQLNFTYNGRKSPDLDIIHTGRMQVTALF